MQKDNRRDDASNEGAARDNAGGDVVLGMWESRLPGVMGLEARLIRVMLFLKAL